MKRVTDPEVLRASYESLPGRKAPGIDGMDKKQYGEALPENITDLSERLRRMAYRPQAVRRVYIPKLNGGTRPLGIPAFEDRIVQDRVAAVLSAIWESEFGVFCL